MSAPKSFFPYQSEEQLLSWLEDLRPSLFRDPDYVEKVGNDWLLHKEVVDENSNRIMLGLYVGKNTRKSESEWKIATVYPREGDGVIRVVESGEILGGVTEGE